MTEADEARLEVAAERCRRMVEGCSLQHASASLSVTLSLGGALARCGEPPSSLLRRADALLYRSKAEGRNRLSIAA